MRALGSATTVGSMGDGPHGLDPQELAEGERVLRHWRAPGGRGILTDRRCLLLGHPMPLHRPIRWTVPLEEVRYVEVAQTENTTVPGWLASSPTETKGAEVGGWSGTMVMASLPGNFVVVVDGTPVFRGYPRQAAQVHGWIEEARSDCLRHRGGSLGAPLPRSSRDASGPEPR